MADLLQKLKQPQVVMLIVLIVVQIGVRFGHQWDNAAVQSDVTTVLDILTAINGLWVAHKSDKNSII